MGRAPLALGDSGSLCTAPGGIRAPPAGPPCGVVPVLMGAGAVAGLLAPKLGACEYCRGCSLPCSAVAGLPEPRLGACRWGLGGCLRGFGVLSPSALFSSRGSSPDGASGEAGLESLGTFLTAESSHSFAYSWRDIRSSAACCAPAFFTPPQSRVTPASTLMISCIGGCAASIFSKLSVKTAACASRFFAACLAAGLCVALGACAPATCRGFTVPAGEVCGLASLSPDRNRAALTASMLTAASLLVLWYVS
mmetsp:Transcript_7235/g.20388  ORF Transcript_7235/g.20388 Transcript_7235/m.20388 type:complete len:251 (-) Transcript_7235:967-1719(-)